MFVWKVARFLYQGAESGSDSAANVALIIAWQDEDIESPLFTYYFCSQIINSESQGLFEGMRGRPQLLGVRRWTELKKPIEFELGALWCTVDVQSDSPFLRKKPGQEFVAPICLISITRRRVVYRESRNMSRCSSQTQTETPVTVTSVTVPFARQKCEHDVLYISNHIGTK